MTIAPPPTRDHEGRLAVVENEVRNLKEDLRNIQAEVDLGVGTVTRIQVQLGKIEGSVAALKWLVPTAIALTGLGVTLLGRILS